METNQRMKREINAEIGELSRRGQLDDYDSPVADVDAAKVGLLLSESISLSDRDVGGLWEGALLEDATQLDEAQHEVQRALQAVGRGRGPREQRDLGSE